MKKVYVCFEEPRFSGTRHFAGVNSSLKKAEERFKNGSYPDLTPVANPISMPEDHVYWDSPDKSTLISIKEVVIDQ